MKILLTGKDGQLGRCFQDIINAIPNYELFAFNSKELDITNQFQVADRCHDISPDIIVNAAAYTAVDKAESETELAFSVNELGVKHLAGQANQLDIPLIHISTDYVFDGSGIRPYKVSDVTNPQGVYGASKLAGERIVAKTCQKYIILRTSWVFSEYGNNFVKTMLRLAKERDVLSVVADQYGCPTYAGDLAYSIKLLCEKYWSEGSLKWGTYHYSGNMPTSWYGFARAILFLAIHQGHLSQITQLIAVNSEQFPTIAKRPKFSVLDMSSLGCLNLSSSDWLSSLENVIGKLENE